MARLFSMFQRYAWLIVLGVLAGGGIAYAVAAQMPSLYESSTTIAITLRSSADNTDQERLMATYEEVMLKPPVLEQVISNLNLDMSVRQLQRAIVVDTIRNSMLIRLEVQANDPHRATMIANEIVSVLSQFSRTTLGTDEMVKNTTLRIVDVAQPNTKPVAPNKKLYTLLGMFVGFVGTIGLVIVREFLDTTVRSRYDVEDALGLPLLVSIPHLRRTSLQTALITATQPFAPITEVYRLLRARITWMEETLPIRTITVTSSRANEGKSTVIANLAVVMSQVGKRVILVDANLRQPALHTIFHVSNDHGVTRALAQHDDNWIFDNLVHTEVDNLSLMPGGPAVPNPAELLESPRMRDLQSQLVQRADIVLFDVPAMLSSVDATIVAKRCDVTLIVARVGAVNIEDLLHIKHHCYSFGLDLFGAVLTTVHNNASSFSASAVRQHMKHLKQSKTATRSASLPQHTKGFFWRSNGSLSGETGKESYNHNHDQNYTTNSNS